MKPDWFFSLRLGLGLWAVLIGIGAVWIVAAEIVGPRLPYFPADARTVQTFADARGPAATAASIGMVRGDLLTTAAVTASAPFLFSPPESASTTGTRTAIETARKTAERAAKSAPHDARNWLVLARLASRGTAPDSNASEMLKLSYYTGPNDFALAPLRLSTAATMPWDEELQSLVQLEIERIVMQRPDLKPAIAAAYRVARAEAKQFIESTLKPVDPNLLETLRGGAR